MKQEPIEAYINPKMLKWARVSLGLPLDDAARKIGIKPRKLNQCEKGEARLTFNQLVEASRAYKRPVAVFYLQEPPEEVQMPDFRRLPESPEQSFSPELRLAIRRIYYQKQAAEQLASYGKIKDWDFVGSIKLDSDPEKTADIIREILNFAIPMKQKWKDNYQAFNTWRQAIEDKGVLVFLVQKVEIREMRGFSFTKAPYPAIALNRSEYPASRVFSLIHEFCHILLDESGLCDPYLEFESKTQNRQVEIFCNHVAGAVLVPSSALRVHKSVIAHNSSLTWEDEEINQITKSFHVSKEVILRRLLILNLATSDNYRKLLGIWKSRPLSTPEREGFGETGSQKLLRLQGKAYVDLVMEAYRQEKITDRDISDYLNMKLKHLAPLQETLP